MPIGQMRQTIFEETNLTLFQDAINDQFRQLAKIPFINGNAVNGVTVSGTTAVNHGLGRQAQGYFITSSSVAVPISNDSFSGTTTITLHATVSTVVNLWVF